MAVFEQLLAIARNTLFESIRQPILLVVLVVCTILVILSNPFSAYTLQDDQRMFVDIGLSTIFIGGAILAAFVASNVLTREIDNRTVLTVVSKPVARPVFVIGKYLGVAGAQVLVIAFLALVFMMVEIHGVQQTVTTPYHLPVILLGFGAGVRVMLQSAKDLQRRNKAGASSGAAGSNGNDGAQAPEDEGR